ncbi:NADH dehydrogenase (ubiquinone) B15 subunit [Calliopsis andreniformis]|uniref:NADH dehydrogenase (ubiquinone) B15 subunit n=1 Tax=Calliopsis andreniformis TaxID=337506 RepID=UPI003FCDEB01
MSSQRINSYDVSRKMREIIDWRSGRRKQLREEYLKEILHPTKHQMVSDIGVERYTVMRLTHEYQARVTGRSVVVTGGTLFGIIFLSIWLVKVGKEREEHLYRTGQVSYADRKFKFC